MSHTPGPWKSFEMAMGEYAVNPANGGLLVCELRTLNPFSPEAAANARLIASAPELLEACRRALVLAEPYEGVAGCGDQQSLCQHLRAAIAKAVGDEKWQWVEQQDDIAAEVDCLREINAELLAALQALVDGGHDHDCDTQAIGDVCNCNAGLRYEAARAAIAKATGKGDGR